MSAAPGVTVTLTVQEFQHVMDAMSAYADEAREITMRFGLPTDAGRVLQATAAAQDALSDRLWHLAHTDWCDGDCATAAGVFACQTPQVGP